MADYRSKMDYNIMENALVSLQRIHIRMDKKNKAYKELTSAVNSIEKVLPLIKPIEDE
jgi:hypothetical protein